MPWSQPLVSVTVVTYNSRHVIARCLDAVLQQEYRPLEVIVVDNASQDDSISILARYRHCIRLIQNERNAGFAAGQNQAIAASRGQWILTLNADVLVQPGFIGCLVATGELDAGVGVACGKLLRIGRDFTIPDEPRIDSTGIYFTPAMRHFDRGWNEPDDLRFRNTEYVFGACAAAALYRRKMIADVSLEDGFFDPDFFAYREDADVAWRSQLLGWRCIYTPGALAYHIRSVVPGSRPAVPAILKMHSVKNRFLMRVKNMTGDLYRRHWLPATARDLLVIGGCLLREPRSLPAFWHIARCLSRALAKRRQIMERRRVSDEYMASWFDTAQAHRPLDPSVQPALTISGTEYSCTSSAPVRDADVLFPRNYRAGIGLDHKGSLN
jgi:GT2 family glycosyltransferase